MNYRSLGRCVVYTSKIGQGKTVAAITQLVAMSLWKTPPRIISNTILQGVPYSPLNERKLLDHHNCVIFFDNAFTMFDYRSRPQEIRERFGHLIPGTDKDDGSFILHEMFRILIRMNKNRIIMATPGVDWLPKPIRFFISDTIFCRIRRRGDRVYLSRSRYNYEQHPDSMTANPIGYPWVQVNKYFPYFDTLEMTGQKKQPVGEFFDANTVSRRHNTV